jgi:hypothetical protein
MLRHPTRQIDVNNRISYRLKGLDRRNLHCGLKPKELRQRKSNTPHHSNIQKIAPIHTTT